MSRSAGFPSGTTNGHQLVNRSSRPARYLEIGNRDPSDTVAYTDVDLACTKKPTRRVGVHAS